MHRGLKIARDGILPRGGIAITDAALAALDGRYEPGDESISAFIDAISKFHET